jgi:hypothetical protein
MARKSILFVLLALTLGAAAALTVAQGCPDGGSGPDLINCEVSSDEDGGNENIFAGGGDDTVNVAPGVEIYHIWGMSGDDSLTNNGLVEDMIGWTGDDTLVNQGDMDGQMWGGSGNDQLVNDGTLMDGSMLAGSGNDTLIVNGVVEGGVYGFYPEFGGVADAAGGLDSVLTGEWQGDDLVIVTSDASSGENPVRSSTAVRCLTRCALTSKPPTRPSTTT